MRRGFTLIELLVVISIISILSSVVLVSLSQARKTAQGSVHIQNLIQIRTALELYKSKHGNYPVSGQAEYFSNDPRLTDRSCSENVGGTHYCAEWIPGLVTEGFMSKLPEFKNDGKTPIVDADSFYYQIVHGWGNYGNIDCSANSTTYFYRGAYSAYKIFVACPPGGVQTNSFNDEGRPTQAYAVCVVGSAAEEPGGGNNPELACSGY
jgi:prepilin-type N-terminal cleavage/methylation domain-containing protein